VQETAAPFINLKEHTPVLKKARSSDRGKDKSVVGDPRQLRLNFGS